MEWVSQQDRPHVEAGTPKIFPSTFAKKKFLGLHAFVMITLLFNKASFKLVML